MLIWQAIILGIVEGVTEFLPISSTGHLTIVEKLMGFNIDDPALTAFTAIIQVGAVLATLIYFRADIVRIVMAWVRGIFHASERNNLDYRMGWAVIIGTIPIAIIGVVFKHQIETGLRSLWFVAIALLAWSGVMWLADRTATQKRHEEQTTWKDTLIIGLVQCLALIPGVSRSGATMSAGLFRGFDRVAVTRLSFFLAIPALLAAGALEAVTQAKNISNGVGWGPTLLATAITFIVAYAAIAWLLKYIARHSYAIFIWYRIVVGLILVILLATGTLAAK
jgi:undecaprenyl-diphosphatase